MSEKIQIEKHVLNKILKAIEIHVSLIESSDIRVPNEFDRTNIAKSIEHLKELPNLVNSTDKQISDLKRKAYSNYIIAKNEYDKACETNDKKAIQNAFETKNKALQYYISLKELYGSNKELSNK